MTPRVALAASLAALSVAAAACSSSGTPSNQAASISATCQLISAVLSDGPDPTVDPVGYAEAQIRPLRGIKTTDETLQTAIDDLATAYEDVYRSNNGAAARADVLRASNRVNGICPGAAG